MLEGKCSFPECRGLVEQGSSGCAYCYQRRFPSSGETLAEWDSGKLYGQNFCIYYSYHQQLPEKLREYIVLVDSLLSSPRAGPPVCSASRKLGMPVCTRTLPGSIINFLRDPTHARCYLQSSPEEAAHGNIRAETRYPATLVSLSVSMTEKNFVSEENHPSHLKDLCCDGCLRCQRPLPIDKTSLL